MGDDNERTRENTRRSHSRNGTAHNKCQAAVSHGADQTSQLKHSDGGEEGPFDIEKGVEFSEK